MRLAIGLLVIVTVTGCVSKTKHDELQKENELLKAKVEELEEMLRIVESENEQLLEEKRKEMLEQNSKPYISESEAMTYIKDYYAFYDKDTRYREIQLRRVDDNSFKVSLEECPSKSGCDEFFWSSVVKTLTVQSNGDYTYGY